MGIKAEYKLYYIDTTSNPGYIQVFEGYATFDMLRKRVFVMAFGAINWVFYNKTIYKLIYTDISFIILLSF